MCGCNTRDRPDDRVFQFSARIAARWIAQGIAKADLATVATGTGVKRPAATASATAAPATGCKAA